MNWTEIVRRVHEYSNVPIFSISGTEVTVVSILTFLLILLVARSVSKTVQRIVGRWLRSRRVMEEGTVAASMRLVHYALMVVGTAVALDTVGVDLGALFAAGAFVAVAVGFAMQNILQNFVSGVILLAEGSITESDVLEVEGKIVRVVRLGTRATVARTRDEEELIIPNSILVQSTVINYTLQDSLYRIKALVGVSYRSDMAQVMNVLDGAARSVPHRDRGAEPRILLIEFANSSVVFEASIWVQDPWRARQTLSELHTAIWWALKENGITIAFPQVDVHFDDAVVRPLEAVAGRGAA